MDPLSIAIIGGLIVAGISGLVGKTVGERLFKKKVKAHLDEFFDSLEKLVKSANRTDDFHALIRKSAALVSNRDEFKNQLDNLSTLLNSDIDKLSILIKDKNLDELKNLEPEIRHLIGIINEKWPGKKIEIEVAKKSLLAKLGIR